MHKDAHKATCKGTYNDIRVQHALRSRLASDVLPAGGEKRGGAAGGVGIGAGGAGEDEGRGEREEARRSGEGKGSEGAIASEGAYEEMGARGLEYVGWAFGDEAVWEWVGEFVGVPRGACASVQLLGRGSCVLLVRGFNCFNLFFRVSMERACMRL